MNTVKEKTICLWNRDLSPEMLKVLQTFCNLLCHLYFLYRDFSCQTSGFFWKSTNWKPLKEKDLSQFCFSPTFRYLPAGLIKYPCDTTVVPQRTLPTRKCLTPTFEQEQQAFYWGSHSYACPAVQAQALRRKKPGFASVPYAGWIWCLHCLNLPFSKNYTSPVKNYMVNWWWEAFWTSGVRNWWKVLKSSALNFNLQASLLWGYLDKTGSVSTA